MVYSALALFTIGLSVIALMETCSAVPTAKIALQTRAQTINCNGIFSKQGTLVIANVNQLYNALPTLSMAKEKATPPSTDTKDSTQTDTYSSGNSAPDDELPETKDDTSKLADLSPVRPDLVMQTNATQDIQACCSPPSQIKESTRSKEHGTEHYRKRQSPQKTKFRRTSDIGLDDYWHTAQMLRRQNDDDTDILSKSSDDATNKAGTQESGQDSSLFSANDTMLALGYPESDDGKAKKALDGVPYDNAVEFTFTACSEVDDMGYEETQTQTVHIWQGHLSISDSPETCVVADKVGVPDGSLITEKCTFSNDISQARQLWQLTRQRKQEGTTARISFYLTFLGEPKGKDVGAGKYSGSHSLRLAHNHIIVSSDPPEDDTAGQKSDIEANIDQGDEEGSEASANDTDDMDEDRGFGRVVYLHMGDERVARRSLPNASDSNAPFASAQMARDTVYEPGQF